MRRPRFARTFGPTEHELRSPGLDIGPLSAALLTIAALLAVALLVPPALAQDDAAQDATSAAPLVLIYDASGSMWGQIAGENKVVIARRSLAGLVDDLADDSEVALVAYGHRREGDCADIETVVPLGPLDRQALKAAVDGLNPKGKTPITASIEQALDLVRDSRATLILLSDGLETCGGDPCETVRLAREGGADLVLHVVGFDVEGEELSQLQCIAQAGGGLFLEAEDAESLSAALDAVVALPVDVPAGRLLVHGVADGELFDVAVHVTRAETGETAANGRTYTHAETNPTSIPLADGRYQVMAKAVRLAGEIERRFEIEIEGGNTVEKTLDFSTGELSIGVTKNGELSDAVFEVFLPGTETEVASGRTYKGEKSNPAKVRLTAGSYDVWIGSVEIQSRPEHHFGTIEVLPGGSVAVSHEFTSGLLKIGAVQGAERIDSVVQVIDITTGKTVAQGRTYVGPPSNPKTFELVPGTYRIQVKSLLDGNPQKQLDATVEAGKTVELDADFGTCARPHRPGERTMKRTTTSLLGLLILLSAFAAPAFGGVIFEVETTNLQTGDTETTQIVVEGKNLKMGIGAGAHAGRPSGGPSADVAIFRGDQQKLMVVDNENEAYMNIDEATIEQLPKSLAGAGDQLAVARQQLQERLSEMSEEQRRALEQALGHPEGGAGNIFGEEDRQPIELIGTGEKAEMHGYSCERWELRRDGLMVRELWVAPWRQVEGGEESAEAFQEMSDFFTKMLDALGEIGGGPIDGDAFAVYSHFVEIDGFPVVTRGFGADGGLDDESVLRSAERRTIDPSEFEPPAGYKRRQMMPAR